MQEAVRKRARFGTKLVLIAGFGGVLGLMATAGLDSIRALHVIETRNGAVTRRYLDRHGSLERIRSSLYLSNTYVRDYVLEATPQGATAARARLEGLRHETLSALQSYLRSSAPEEASLVSDLNRRVTEYWKSLEPVFRWTPDERGTEGFRFLETQVFPRRALLIAIADRMDAINEKALRDGYARSAELFSGTRARVVAILGMMLAIGVLLAAWSIVYILRLESESRARFLEVRRTQDELKRLSARLVEAQEQERRAISRELHDEVGQLLNALLVDLGNLAAVTAGNEQAHTLLATARDLADQGVKALRNMALLLRPSMLDDFGLVPALHWQAREVSRRTSMRVYVDADDSADDLPEEYRTCIYRVVQEALHNCSRHAEARSVRIGVRRDADRLRLTVQDDGKGFDAVHVRGLGLIGMEERITHLNGTLTVQSQPGQGALLTIELPLAPVAQAAEVA